MDPHFIAIPFPSAIKKSLASICFGLPQVHWVEEENLHFTLRYFGPLSNLALSAIQEHLRNLYFLNFSLTLRGISHMHSRGNHGTIRVGIEENSHLLRLRKEIDKQLRTLQLPREEKPYSSHVTLGHYERLNPQKLGDYLFTHADYQSASFTVDKCLLLRTHQTPKHIYYQTIETYPASHPPTSDD